MADYSVIACAYVRKKGRAWREADTEIVTLRASRLIDREHYAEGGVTGMRPRAALTIDGAPCCRFRLGDGRIAAVTITYARSIAAD